MLYAEAARATDEFARENAAWLIASVANIAGAKPKVTVNQLLRRKAPETTPRESMQQNAVAAGLLEAMAKAPPPKPGAEPAPRPSNGRVAPDDLERMQAEAAKRRGPVVAQARPGDAPVPMHVAKANLEKFRAQMKDLQRQIDERKAREAKHGGG